MLCFCDLIAMTFERGKGVNEKMGFSNDSLTCLI